MAEETKPDDIALDAKIGKAVDALNALLVESAKDGTLTHIGIHSNLDENGKPFLTVYLP